jgi:hypothetical protein
MKLILLPFFLNFLLQCNMNSENDKSYVFNSDFTQSENTYVITPLFYPF